MSNKNVQEVARYSMAYICEGYDEEQAEQYTRAALVYALREMEKLIDFGGIPGTPKIRFLDYDTLTITLESEDRTKRFVVALKQSNPFTNN